jgi:L,D-transpeptidase catalytic domain
MNKPKAGNKSIAGRAKPPAMTITVPDEVALALKARSDLKSSCDWIFEVDYSINSRKPRLFIYNVQTKGFYKYKCAHGSGGKNKSPNDGNCREVSNKNGSNCSSLGIIRTGEHYNSDMVGQAVRLTGLSSTNNNVKDRGVVVHGGNYVHDNASNTDTTICGRSWGCIVVDEQYIDRKNGGELIEWLKGGAIGVTHYAGRFTI